MLEDVETLNQWALQGKLDITKLSFPAFFQSLDKYVLLNAGSALGKGVGPLLISNREQGMTNDEINRLTIALPGINTTANLLFSFAYPDAKNKIFMRFDKIEDFVLNDSSTSPSPNDSSTSPSPSLRGTKQMERAGVRVRLGVIIHENRFTYQQKGLHKVVDLGEYWEQEMKVPIPLGGIVIKRSVDKSISLKVDTLIRKSLEFAFANYPLITPYVRQHSQTMSEEVMRQHIDLYVNDYSIDLGPEGKTAIETLQKVFSRQQSATTILSSGGMFLS